MMNLVHVVVLCHLFRSISIFKNGGTLNFFYMHQLMNLDIFGTKSYFINYSKLPIFLILSQFTKYRNPLYKSSQILLKTISNSPKFFTKIKRFLQVSFNFLSVVCGYSRMGHFHPQSPIRILHFFIQFQVQIFGGLLSFYLVV